MQEEKNKETTELVQKKIEKKEEDKQVLEKNLFKNAPEKKTFKEKSQINMKDLD